MSATLTHVPTFVDPLPDVPAFLKNIPNWIRWRIEIVNGKATKVPYRVDGRKAASTRPDDWTDYQTAVTGTTIDSNGGVGFVVNGGIVGFDLDGCRDPKTGEITSWAQAIIDDLDAYTEITPSQTGLRVWVPGTLPVGDKVFNLDRAVGFGDKVKIEVFTDSRYFTKDAWLSREGVRDSDCLSYITRRQTTGVVAAGDYKLGLRQVHLREEGRLRDYEGKYQKM